MMPGQEKMVMDFYKKNPSAVASLKGNVYEQKIMDLIKKNSQIKKKEITKLEAEKILKEALEKENNLETKKIKSDKSKAKGKKVKKVSKK